MTDQTPMQLSDAELDAVTGGAMNSELALINLQSLISQRSNALTLMSNMMKSMNDTTRSVINNIR